MDIDLRHAIVIAINTFKSAVGMPWDWDPFHTISNLTSWTYAFVFLVFAFIPIKVHFPLTPSTHSTTTNAVLLAFEELSAPLAVALMASALILPQALFWYAYPIIVLIFSFFGQLKRFADWFHNNVLTALPVLNVANWFRNNVLTALPVLNVTATIVGRQVSPTEDLKAGDRGTGMV